jgi:DNA-binding NarL/FixJ family response regulator
MKADLILLDFSMPKMNGLEAAVALKKASPEAVVVMFTMFESLWVRRRAQQRA